MQKLTKNAILDALSRLDNSVIVQLPLPTTPLKTQQWVAQFSRYFNLVPSKDDWGADRYQVVLTPASNNALEACLLNIEWMCEAIWLEPVSKQLSAQEILEYLGKFRD
ncbi:hypothetical protein D210916BOD24_34250 [Alteromonas sp. D210916BOD_24]|uniref:hypothetical protein n=1 Tax=Alteromonas sp. D210916BOD_24 TaxID=3157618 RepID=UPI00399C83CC